MTNTEIAKKLKEIVKDLGHLSSECMFNNHEQHERLNALLMGNIESARLLLDRTAFYLP